MSDATNTTLPIPDGTTEPFDWFAAVAVAASDRRFLGNLPRLLSGMAVACVEAFPALAPEARASTRAGVRGAVAWHLSHVAVEPHVRAAIDVGLEIALALPEAAGAAFPPARDDSPSFMKD